MFEVLGLRVYGFRVFRAVVFRVLRVFHLFQCSGSRSCAIGLGV